MFSRMQTCIFRSTMYSLYCLCVALASVMTAPEAANIRIGAFNIQVFGKTKAANDDVMNILAKVIQRYDILLIQEIRDIKGQAIYDLLDKVNKLGPEEYDVVISERLGRTSSKEQYAFMYRWKSSINVVDTYQYPDVKDVFEREPFAVMFSIEDTAVQRFVLAGIHVDPDDAVEEINALVAVHDDLVAHWNNDNIVIMGDFNADCSYVSNSASETLLLRDPKFNWLIDDDVDTTTKSTNCAYDRIILTGKAMLQCVIPDSGLVFYYDQVFNLTAEETEDVSDHYPVEFELYRLKTSDSSQANQHIPKWISSLLPLLAKYINS